MLTPSGRYLLRQHGFGKGLEDRAEELLSEIHKEVQVCGFRMDYAKANKR
jgi:hypothetical protein